MGRIFARQAVDDPSLLDRRTRPAPRAQGGPSRDAGVAGVAGAALAAGSVCRFDHAGVAFLQRAAGNRAVGRLLRPGEARGESGMGGVAVVGTGRSVPPRGAVTVQRHAFGAATPNKDADKSGPFDENGAAGPLECEAPAPAEAPAPPETAAPSEAVGLDAAATAGPAPTDLDDLTAQAGGLIARQGEAEAVSGPLTAAQVADAIRYYRVQPWKYTEAIVTELQTRLGITPASGHVDEATVQAVAVAQQAAGGDPALVVDGKAGPRTLPRLFQSGLNEAGEAQKYSAEVQSDVIAKWETLGTPEARYGAILGAANERLDAAEVPPMRAAPLLDEQGVVGGCGGASGQFNFPAWQMIVPRTEFAPPTLTTKQANEIAESTYHEARHAQQWFWMARFLAGRGRSARGIKDNMGIPGDVAQAAFDNPLPKGSMQALIAEGWYDTWYGAFADHTAQVEAEAVRASRALCAAKKRAKKNPTPANLAAQAQAQARFDRALAAYKDLPIENDAFATADPVQIAALPLPGEAPGTATAFLEDGGSTSETLA